MPALLLGPLLRHVDTNSATVWVETDGPCTVEVAGCSAHTFHVAGHYYALVVITGLEPGTSTPYEVTLDGAAVWPLPDGDLPPSRIRTFPEGGDPEFVLAFGSCRMPDSTDPDEQRTMGPDALAAYAERMRDRGRARLAGLVLPRRRPGLRRRDDEGDPRVDLAGAAASTSRRATRSRTSRSTPGSTSSRGRLRWCAG